MSIVSDSLRCRWKDVLCGHQHHQHHPGWLGVVSTLLHRRRSMTDVVPMLFRFSDVFHSFFVSVLDSSELSIHRVVTCECFCLPDFMLTADDLLLLEYVCTKK